MTMTRQSIKAFLVALSLTVTLGEWATLARHEVQPTAPPPPTPKAIVRTVELPPIPTVVRPPDTNQPVSFQSEPVATLDLPPIPELPSIPQVSAPAPRQQRPHPVARTRSSR